MRRHFNRLAIVVLLVGALPVPLLASDNGLLLAEYTRGGGGYLAWWKILIVAAIFLLWVFLTDWLNRDSMKLGEDTGLKPEVWNPISVISLLIGFFCAISIPIFWAGLPVFLIATLFPVMTYFFLRRGHLKDSPGLRQKASAQPGNQAAQQLEALPQDEGTKMSFTPAGDKEQQKVNLIRARQTNAFIETKDLLANCISSRADQMLLDYTREQVNGRILVDGSWHALPVMDRMTGDAMLASMKYLAGLSPQDRRSRQEGRFLAKTESEKVEFSLTSQGTQTGERALLKINRKSGGVLNLNQLGMLPESSVEIEKRLNSKGIVIMSAPQGGGYTSSWQGVLDAADRITRDCVAVVPFGDNETTVENIRIVEYAKDESPEQPLHRLLLSQPDFVAFPELKSAAILDTLTEQANEQNRSVLIRIHAKSAAEALLRFYMLSEDRPQFAKAVTAVTNQRLLRRLCTNCRVETPVQPQLIQQMGGDPRTQRTLFNQYIMPPPDQQVVDDKGKPVEIEPCEVCSGIGFIGRIAAFESILVDDSVRQVLIKTPKIDAIEKAARAKGKLSLSAQAYKLALLGITSLGEVQRVMKSG